MNKTVLISISVTLILAGACAQNPEAINAATGKLSELKVESVSPRQLPHIPQQDLYSDGRTKLIKTANYRFEVDNVKKNTDAIILSVRKFSAYISSSSLHLENPILENKMTIRIQNEFFHNLLKEIDVHARFVNQRDVTTADVSKDFVDLESRLKTKREVEARYMEILRKKAGTIEELLHTEQQIGSLHEEIEATISRINYLKEQVTYSTINLEFYQTVTQELQAADEVTIGDEFREALVFGWHGIVAFGIAITYIWPLLIIGVAVVVFVRYKNIRRAI